jgi:hypothetical protein
MDAEKFALTVLMALVIAVVIRLSLAVARRFKIRLPWDATITGCPRCVGCRGLQFRNDAGQD